MQPNYVNMNYSEHLLKFNFNSNAIHSIYRNSQSTLNYSQVTHFSHFSHFYRHTFMQIKFNNWFDKHSYHVNSFNLIILHNQTKANRAQINKQTTKQLIAHMTSKFITIVIATAITVKLVLWVYKMYYPDKYVTISHSIDA